MKISFLGDVYPGPEITKSLVEGTRISKSIRNLIDKADFSMFNLEAPLTSNQKSILKTGPAIKGSTDFTSLIKQLGFDAVSLANNHILDFGEKGLNDTIDSLKKNKVAVFGAGMNRMDAMKELVLKKQGLEIALVAFAENEWSTILENGSGANPVNAVDNFNQIVNLKNKYDHVVVVHHGGNEFYELPSPGLKKLFHFYVDVGASAVINHHTHCISGFEVYQNAPIFYSLGNFIFEKAGSDPMWNRGLHVVLEFDKGTVQFEYDFIEYSPSIGEILVLQGNDRCNSKEKITKLNQIIEDNDKLKKSFDLWVKKNSRSYKSYIQPHGLRYLQSLQNRNLFPDFWSKRKKLYLLNLIRCESHREILTEVLKHEVLDKNNA